MKHQFPATLGDYCERLDASFWAEPVNAWTNLAFLVAAFAAFLLWRRAGKRDLPGLWLILVVVAVGIGSFLFHTVATWWALLADTVPIAIFVHSYFFIALRRYAGASLLAACLWTALLFASGPLASWLLHTIIPGSAGYVPALAALIGLSLVLRWQASGEGIWRDAVPKQAARGLMLAAVLFAISLTARILDRPLCGGWPLGTHFLWHLMNAVVLFVLARLAVLIGPRPANV